MRQSSLAAALVAVGLMVAGADPARGQGFPNKPLRLVTVGAGGGSDLMARIIVRDLAPALGQPIVIENRAGGVIAIETVARAAPDGYTILFYSSSVWVLPLLQPMPYDPVRDFSPITTAASSPTVLVVHPSVAAKSVPELIALARAKPGELNYATGASGSATHLPGELFKAMAGVNIVRVPYKGTAPALNDVIGGHVQVMFCTPEAVSTHVRSGRLRALAVTSAQPSALFPGLPTVAAAGGLPGYESTVSYSFFAPARTPAALINRLNREIARVLDKPEVKERFQSSGVEVASSSPAQVTALMKAEIARWTKVIKEANIRADN
jgi:tripartite-type tricarboxylate transporter receptor subunit TctC